MQKDTQRGSRIREERARLDLSQQAAADAVGIRREMWAKYESGSEPGANALAAMAGLGFDVMYLLTGQPSQQQSQTMGRVLAPREEALLANYGAADEAGRKIIEGAADLAAQSKTSLKRTKKAA